MSELTEEEEEWEDDKDEILIKIALHAENLQKMREIFNYSPSRCIFRETMPDESSQFSLNFAFLLSQTPRDFKELSEDFPANVECQ